MVRVSSFYGIDIQMHFDEHNPPHFHARYAEYEIEVTIQPIDVLVGDAPARVISMVLEWAALNQNELMDNWNQQRLNLPPRRLPPLK
jgi:hypothetical protein